MHILIKTIISLTVILIATAIGKRLPALSGLIAVMPLTGMLVLVWLHLDSGGDPEVMRGYTKGALWGILPTILFFLAASLCYKKRLSLHAILLIGFSVWLAGAFIHQFFLK